jgi:hypothetical protein
MKEYQDFFTELETHLKGFDKDKKFNLLINTGQGTIEKLHSNLIADFIRLKKEYFDLFIEQIDLEPGFIEYKNDIIYRELPAKGFIDISIRDKKKIIIIENKVNDPGKCGQLQKYCDALQDEFEIIKPFYLTKYGKLPPNDCNSDIKCLSYEKDIVNWLDKCIEKTTDPSDNRIKVSLEIYVELVRNMINRDKYMEKVFDYLQKDKNKMSLAIDVYNTLNGRNFFEDTEIRERFKSMFEDYFNDNEIPFDWNEIENNKNNNEISLYCKDDNNPIGDFYFHLTEIYAQFPGEIVVPDSTISGSNLSNETLKALLTNDKEKVNSYIAKCVDAMLNYQKNTN